MLNEELLRAGSGTQRAVAEDEQLERAVVAALNANVQVPPNHVAVLAHDGRVTLQGKVDWKYQSLAAVASAKQVAGVKGVDNQILVEIS